ncbi:hypothetical protein TanjilG_32784 [Lupinus angustifolius]|uniref:Peptidase A1 domain-containing protein n=1 Tax=Lupinus angustifolius TaxID=3871 RepID=A0A4P1RG30_LUPAN|nr:PREDICTED: protein ASPARTIC PROTEASE IN GUARD CELL 1-like [Lupinus angustifolius]OIW10044.1 hypothetical protein TanjilG_32784 [Lupinus angustifolius]
MSHIFNPPLLFLTTLALAFSFTLSLSPRNAAAISHEISTTVLHLKPPSLHQTQQQVLSYNPKITIQQKKQPNPTQTTSPSFFSLPLHPRDSLFTPHHNDYQTLTRSRLDRDSARLKSLINNLDCKCTRPRNITAPIISGAAQNSGEYFTRIGVGHPAQQFYLFLDTGSDITWLQCKPCTQCYKQSDPIFDPTKSTSYKSLTCKARQCKDTEMTWCINNTCQYNVSYGDGSLTAGNLMTETVSFGSTGSLNRIAIGCGHFNIGLFVGAAGILALGSGPLSFHSQIKASSFSYCLVNRDSRKSSTLEFNSPRPSDSLTTRLVKNPQQTSLYYVEFTGINVGGKNVVVPRSTFKIEKNGEGGMVIDSGTAVTRLEPQAYESVRDEFRLLTEDLKRASGPPLFDTCYDFWGMSEVEVPTVSFEVSEGKLWNLPAENYLIPVDENGTYCFAFATSNFPASILGNVQQQGARISFDLVDSIVGISPQEC